MILPFELNHDWNYADPAVQSDVLARISAWVVRYRGTPALRIWAPGNEDLHRILYPKWVSQEHEPAARARAEAFAAFLPRLVDRIHELDPDHPVLYRDAEDVYLGWLKPVFERPQRARPWFVYGANVYSDSRLQEIIATWPAQWVGGPLVISEFAPAGRGAGDRAQGYQMNGGLSAVGLRLCWVGSPIPGRAMGPNLWRCSASSTRAAERATAHCRGWRPHIGMTTLCVRR